MKTILIAAGGTGGHIYPGLAIADQLAARLPDARLIFVGSHVGMEKNIVPKYGYPLELIRARGFERGFSAETLAAVKGVFDSVGDSRKLLKKYQPNLVIGTGGFTCGMLLREAARRKIPTLIHEQNAFPGRSNRMLGKTVDRVAISFEEARSYFPAEKTVFTGNPVREAFKNADRSAMRRQLGLGPDQKMILAVGGSQGAASINRAMIDLMAGDTHEDRVFWHLTGKDQYEPVCEHLKEKGVAIHNAHIEILPFSTEMDKLLSAADLVISRSGAMSIAELAAVGTPSILIPYPLAAGDHQRMNAQAIVDLGGGVMIEDSALDGKILKKTVNDLLSRPEKLAAMRIAVKGYGTIDADERIAEEALALIKKA
jgi:UDP-N-acetylglucosamine--N-acetylmuramyl-(pentapeptide) pyrophosphoryl-undecaprenol N-acetylglucosamine transferase